MDMESVLEVVKLLTSLLAGTVRSRSREKIQRLSAWTWGILGKCNDAGQLGSEEISELRELGKRAVGLLVGIRDRSGKVYGYQKDEEEEEAEKAEEDVIEDGLERSEEDEIHVPTRRSADQQITDPTATAMEGYSEAAPKDNELEHAKAVLQARLHLEEQPQLNGTQAKEGEVEEDTSNKLVEMSVDKQVRVLLDMVITIIGEFYGQRDLLEFRDIWDEELSSPSV